MPPSIKEKVNPLETVNHLSKQQLQEQIEKWMETQQGKLQSKLRMELVENFNKTNLGREINAQIESKQGFVLNPALLVINTLVSEFLFSEDYHFTLSVFTSEVSFPHTLPNFSQEEKFRFNQEQMESIFDALGLNESSTKKEISQNYEKGGKSLLFSIIKNLIPQISKNEGTQPDVRNLMILNKTVEKLSKSVKNMADHYLNMENTRHSSFKNNSKVERDREERHHQNLIRHIEVVCNKLDKCALTLSNFEGKFKNNPPQPQAQSQEPPFDSYKSWLQVMKTTPNGQKYINKFQRALLRMWEHKKQELRKYYQEKFEQERREFLTVQGAEMNKDVIKEILQQKMDNLEKRDASIGSKIEKIHEAINQKGTENFEKMSKNIAETLKSVQKSVLKIPVDASQAHSHRSADDVDQIIKGAKSRIRQLEAESEKLEKSFAEYMERQINSKQNMQADRIKLWQDYQLERRTLTSKLPQNSSTKTFEPPNKKPLDSKTTDSLTSDHDILQKIPSSSTISNPFKSFDTLEYLQKAHEKRILTAPKYERLEAYRRLDREVEAFKNNFGFKPSTSRSIFAQSSVQSQRLKEVQLEIPRIEIETQTSPIQVVSSEKGSENESHLNIQDVSLDIDLSKTKSSLGSGKERKTPEEKKEEPEGPREEVKIAPPSLIEIEPSAPSFEIITNQKQEKVIEPPGPSFEVIKPFTESPEFDEKALKDIEKQAKEVLEKTFEIIRPFDQVQEEKEEIEVQKRQPLVEERYHEENIVTSSSDSEKIVISAGKRSSSEASEDFWN